MSRNITDVCEIERWAPNPLRSSGASLLFPEDLAGPRTRRRFMESSAFARARETGWEARARETESAQLITVLKKRVEELEGELQERSRGNEIPCGPLSREVAQLLAGELSAEEMDDLIAVIHAQIAAGNKALAYELACVAAGIPAPDELDARCLALEVLATAQSPGLEPLLHPLIGFCLASDMDRLQFRAIGAANTLPRAMRTELRPAIEEVVARSAPESAARRLGKLFLEYNK